LTVGAKDSSGDGIVVKLFVEPFEVFDDGTIDELCICEFVGTWEGVNDDFDVGTMIDGTEEYIFVGIIVGADDIMNKEVGGGVVVIEDPNDGISVGKPDGARDGDEDLNKGANDGEAIGVVVSVIIEAALNKGLDDGRIDGTVVNCFREGFTVGSEDGKSDTKSVGTRDIISKFGICPTNCC